MPKITGHNREAEHSKPRLNRRSVLVGGTTLIVGAGVVSNPAQAATENAEKLLTQSGDRIQFIKGKLKGEFARPEHLIAGDKQVEAFPFDVVNDVIRRKNRLNRLLLIRAEQGDMDDETQARSAEGVLAFSAICTHTGCTIKSFKPKEQHLRCHCHLSEFDILSVGSVRSGPAKRALPMVPLALDDEGFLIAAEGFTQEPGGSKK